MIDDVVQPFQIDGPGLRGRLVRLGSVVDTVLARHDYPAAVAGMLGEALALAAALAGALKYEGVFTIQTKGDGPIRLMVADVTSAGQMRGYAQFDADRLAQAQAGPIEASVPRLLGAGYLAFTVDQGADTERYQGIVELDGATLAECAHHYFRQSEQIEAGIRVACGQVPTPDGGLAWRAGALMLQRVPDLGGAPRPPRDLPGGDGAPEEVEDEADDDWRRSLLLMGSSTSAELLDPALAPNDLLFRLFHEDGVRVYRGHRLRAECRCSRERVASVLGALPKGDVTDLGDDGAVVVTCEFCGTDYAFSEPELAALYEASGDS